MLRERRKKWTKEQLESAVASSTSVRQVLNKLSLIEAGGNYDQIKKYIKILKFDTSHFRGMAWNKGLKGIFKTPYYSLEQILVRNSTYQSFKLKRRLFQKKLKNQECELCGWAETSSDGRIPLELDHINVDRHDNRLENLRILCPNCHSLQTTHRGRNMLKHRG